MVGADEVESALRAYDIALAAKLKEREAIERELADLTAGRKHWESKRLQGVGNALTDGRTRLRRGEARKLVFDYLRQLKGGGALQAEISEGTGVPATTVGRVLTKNDGLFFMQGERWYFSGNSEGADTHGCGEKFDEDDEPF